VELSSPCFNRAVPATDEIIWLTIRALPEIEDPFAVLDAGDYEYLQTLWTPDGYVLEYQEQSLTQHYRAVRRLTADEVTRAFQLYARGDRAWLSGFKFEHLDPETWDPIHEIV